MFIDVIVIKSLNGKCKQEKIIQNKHINGKMNDNSLYCRKICMGMIVR